MKSKGRNFFYVYRKELFWCNLWILRSLDLVQGKMKWLCEEHKDRIMTTTLSWNIVTLYDLKKEVLLIISWEKKVQRVVLVFFGHDTMTRNLIKLNFTFQMEIF